MDGRGRCIDNIFIERLWRSLKHEEICLEELVDGFNAQRVIQDGVASYNTEWFHSALERRKLKEAYWTGQNERLAA